MRDSLPPHVIAFFWPDANPEDIQEQYANLVWKQRKSRKRQNVISWSDINAMTNRVTELQRAMADYAARGYEDGALYGDQNVFVHLIGIQEAIEKLRERHRQANQPRMVNEIIIKDNTNAQVQDNL